MNAMMIQSILGIIGLILITCLFSENKKKIRLQSIVIGLLLQFGATILLLKVPALNNIMLFLSRFVTAIQRATTDGTSFLFGFLGGGPLPYKELSPGASWILAFQGLPLLIVVSALSALLFYWRIIPCIVWLFSLCLQKTMKVSGALSVGVATNIFMGMMEAPLLIAPYIKKMSRSELLVLMISGMATISGTVLVFYSTVLEPIIPGALGHIITASIISAPAAIMIARIMVPETISRQERQKDGIQAETYASIFVKNDMLGPLDAIIKGTGNGITLFINIVAVLLVFVALVSLTDQLLGALPDLMGASLSLERIFAFFMWPVVWLMGIPPAEAGTAASLMGTKIVLNELIAYMQMAGLEPDILSERSRLIMLYGMCGFANFGSMGILVGGLSSLVPERKAEILALGWKSVFGGVLATCITGAIIGFFY